MSERKTYKVRVTYAVRAASPEEAALKTQSFGSDLAPTDFTVTDPSGETTRIPLPPG